MKIMSTIAMALLIFAMPMVGSNIAFGQDAEELEMSDEQHTNPRIVVDGEEHTNPRIVVDGEAAEPDADSEAPDDADSDESDNED